MDFVLKNSLFAAVADSSVCHQKTKYQPKTRYLRRSSSTEQIRASDTEDNSCRVAKKHLQD